MPTRSIVYIDGFNLYYGAIRGSSHKWLNLERFFRLVRQSDQIERIYYFTALVGGPSDIRQQTYLHALATCPLVKVILGKYKEKRILCQIDGCTYPNNRRFKVPEEKRTDVNIAVQMLDDAYRDACDLSILVSGDSDLVPGVNRIKLRFPKKRVLVYVPSRDPMRGAAVELRASADEHRDFPLAPLAHSQFPRNIPDGSGGILSKPAGW
jgi:uncharacterized LabA/DUF88 family protein